MIFIKKDEERYNIGQTFFSKKQSKDLCRVAVAFFLRYFILEKIRAVSTALQFFQYELSSKSMQSMRNFKLYRVLENRTVSVPGKI